MRQKMKLIYGIVLVLFSGLVLAAPGVGTGKIIGYIPYSVGTEEIFFINIENVSNTPTCNTTSRFTMKSSNPKFKITQAAVLAAFVAQIQVRANGMGTCDNFPNSEDLNYVCLGTTPC